MKSNPSRKGWGWKSGILSGLFLAVAACTGPNGHQKPEIENRPPPSDIEGSADIFGVQPAPATKQFRDVTVAHIEDTNYFLKNMFMFEYHGRTAYRITDWQNNGHIDTNLYDYDPFQYSDFNLELIEFFDVISISSVVGGLITAIDQDAVDDVWEKSSAIAVMATGNNGNSFCPARFNADAQEEIYKLGRSVYSSGDTVLRVGAISDGEITCYSSENQPDFVYETAFDQGFCTEYYMTQAEIDAFMQTFPDFLRDYYRQALGDDVFTAHPEAGGPSCDINGTSFVSPNVARIFANILSEYPDLHEYELVATALLASTPVDYGTNPAAAIQESEYTVVNERGLRSDRISGFGAYDPDAHRKIIEELLQYKAATHLDTQPVRLESDGQFRVISQAKDFTSYGVTIDDPGTVLRSVIQMRIDIDPNKSIYAQSIPEEIILVSPSGTEMKLIAIDDTRSKKDAAGYHLSGAASAFFGEEAQGEWTIRIPNKTDGSPLAINELEVLQWATEKGGVIDLVLDLHEQKKAAAPAPVPAASPAGPAP